MPKRLTSPSQSPLTSRLFGHLSLGLIVGANVMFANALQSGDLAPQRSLAGLAAGSVATLTSYCLHHHRLQIRPGRGK